MSATVTENTVHDLVPLLFVEDIARSLGFYRDTLGFERVDAWEPGGKLAWCYLKRGGAALMLQQATDEDGPPTGRGHGVGFYFYCDDADGEYARLHAGGLVLDPPKIAFYGMKQLFVTDPDGYALCFQNRVKPT
jgi:uncharacterized glyoxalase superfamily protein PhnB